MTFKLIVISSLAIASLTACDSGKKDDEQVVSEKSAQVAEASTIEKATGSVVEKVKEMVTIDTSSVEAFKTSLSDMNDSLSDTDKSKLTSALGSLAKKAVKEKSESGGLLDMAKSATSGSSAKEQIYQSFGSKLKGMNFKDLLDYAK